MKIQYLTRSIFLLLLLLICLAAPQARAQNVFVTNSTSKPVPVNVVSGGGGASGEVTVGANASTTATTNAQGVKAVAAAGTPVLLVASQTLVESVEIHARKNVTTANTGNIYVGFSSTGGQNYRVLQPGEAFVISAPAGKKIDLHTIYIDAATNADAVTYTSIN